MGHQEFTPKDYVPLQVYSKAAILSGIHATSSPTELLEAAQNAGEKSMALTNPNFLDLAELMNAGKKIGVKPIPGVSLLVKTEHSKTPERVTALARNKEGLEFLFHLITLVMAQNEVLTPERINSRGKDEEILLYWHGNSEMVSDNPFDEVNFRALEAPTVGTPKKEVLKLHEAHIDKLVVMPPVTMATAKDKFIRDFLTATKGASRLNGNTGTYLNETMKSASEISLLYSLFPEAIARTAEHAALSSVRLPQKPESKALIAGEENADEFLTKTVFQKLERLSSQIDLERLRERVLKELQLIKVLGFADYMLMSYEIAQFCEENKIEFMVSGSANNSVVLWLLGVVKIDPQSLLFERFINAERGDSLPDTDFLLAQSDVAKVMNYFMRRYSAETVRLVKIAHLGRDSILKVAKKKDLRLTEEQVNELVQAEIPSGISTHASGVGMSRKAPLLMTGGGIVVSHWDKTAIEKGVHGYKFDFLSSQALSAIKNTLELLRQAGITPIIPLDDEEAYKKLLQGKTTAKVYGDTPHLQQELRDVGSVSEKSSLDEVAHALALARLTYQAREAYLNNHIETHPFASYPEIRNILEKTRYVAIFQDQLLELATEVMGLSWKEADGLRKMMSENVDWDTKSMMLQTLAKKLEEKLYPPHVTQLLQQQLLYFNSYSFVEGHARALGHLLYVQSYLEKEFPAHFWAGVFSESTEKNSDIQTYVNEMLRQGVHFVFPPHLPAQTEIADADYLELIPATSFLGSAGLAKYEEFRLLLDAGTKEEIIHFQEKNFPIVMTHNPVEQFPKQFSFNPDLTRQTMIGKVVLRRKMNEVLYVTLDGSEQINAVISDAALAEMKTSAQKTLQRNSFYKVEIGKSARRDDQWVILKIHQL